MGTQGRNLASIVARQHGVVTSRQLREAGISARRIKKQRDKGLLIDAYRGVYRVGHAAASDEADYMAAVLACGEGAWLRRLAAAHLLGMRRRAKRPEPEVLTLKERQVEGIETVRTRRPDPRDVTIYRGIPVTTPARTLTDLADAVSAPELARAVHQADVLHGTTPDDVEAVLKRRPTTKGAAALRRILWGDADRILSKLEKAFIRLLRTNNLPLPKTNRPAGSRLVDCRWPEHRLTVELDGYRFHRSRHAWELDRQRERQAYARGDQFRRYTWGDVVEHPAPTLTELRAVLAPV
jgi:very-short-patch-repair endonuclease